MKDFDLLTFLIFGLIVIYFGTQIYRRVQTGRLRQKLGDQVELIIPINGLDAFLGISSKGLVCYGKAPDGYEGTIPIAKIRQIKFEAGMLLLTLPRLKVEFIDEKRAPRTARFLGLGTLGGLVAGGTDEQFADISSKAIARWEAYMNKNYRHEG